MWEKILNIEEVGDVDMIDIEVSGNHLFYANDILTHNSNSDLGLEDTSECIWINEKANLIDGSIKTMCDLVPGDQIISNDGFKTVMFVHHKKPKDCIKIKTKSGKEIIVSKEHIFPSNKGRVSYNTGLAIGTKLNVR